MQDRTLNPDTATAQMFSGPCINYPWPRKLKLLKTTKAQDEEKSGHHLGTHSTFCWMGSAIDLHVCP